MAPTPVLYVHHREDLGGAPRSLAELIAQLDGRWEPHVYVPPGRSAELFAQAGAEVHTGPVAMFGHSWDNPYAGLRWLLLGREAARLPGHVARFEALLRRYRFPIVHLNEAQLLVAGALAKRHGARVVWHLRSALAASGAARRRAVAGAISRWGDIAIAIDEDVAASFPLRTPIEIVFNGVVTPGRAPSTEDAKRALGLPLGRVTVGYVGHLRRIKGWEDLLRAVALLREEPVHLVFVGGGIHPRVFFEKPQGRALRALRLVDDDESAARVLVSDLGLGDRVTFLPFTHALADVYAALDIVTFPNRGVGLGRPVLEAAAFGRPVVASGSSGGAGILLPGKTGVLVAGGRPEGLADALRLLSRDRSLRDRFGEAGRAHAAAYDAATAAMRVAAVYQKLLPTGAGVA